MGDIAKLAASIKKYADTHSAATIGDADKKERLKDIQAKLLSLGWTKSFMGMGLVVGDKKASIKFSLDHAIVTYTAGKKGTIEFGDDPAYAVAEKIDTEVRKLLGVERINPNMRQDKIDAVADMLHQQFDYAVKIENETVIRATKYLPETKVKSTFTVAYDMETGYFNFIFYLGGVTDVVTKSGKLDHSKLTVPELVKQLDDRFMTAMSAVTDRDKQYTKELIEKKQRKLKEDRSLPGFPDDVDADSLYESWKRITGNKPLLQNFRQRLLRERAEQDD